MKEIRYGDKIQIEAQNDNSKMAVGTSLIIPTISEVKWTTEAVKYGQKANNGDLNKTVIKTAQAKDLPDYVLQDIDKWIVSYSSISDKDLKVEDREWHYVAEVSHRIVTLLNSYNNIVVYLTKDLEVHRDGNILLKKQIKGEQVISERRAVANDNKADCFLSLHCDGQATFKTTGVIIPRDADSSEADKSDISKSRQLGNDIMNRYSLIQTLYVDKKPDPVVQLSEEKGVIIKSNKTQRRIIIEFGRMTNPNDIRNLYSNGAKDTIAQNLVDGIIYNINNRFIYE